MVHHDIRYIISTLAASINVLSVILSEVKNANMADSLATPLLCLLKT
jgi:hypothetical protein